MFLVILGIFFSLQTIKFFVFIFFNCSQKHSFSSPEFQLYWDLIRTVLTIAHSFSFIFMKLKFFMFHHRKNLVREKLIGKKWIYLERYTFNRQNAVYLKRWERPWEKPTPQTAGAISEGERPTHSFFNN